MEAWEKALELRNQLSDATDNTIQMVLEDPVLNESVHRSIASQKIVLESSIMPGRIARKKAGQVLVSKRKTLEAAAAYRGQKTAVLSFASALYPGGTGHAGQTQEECLCRESTLYACISDDICIKSFYEPHRSMNDRYNADLIHTPDVTVFKTSDTVPVLLPESKWFPVDVITMAAPDCRVFKYSDEQLLKIFEQRFNRIMQCAREADIDILILGAFGCGEFKNDPTIVATAAARSLERYREAFNTIEFAIYEGRKKTKFRQFRMVLDRYLNNEKE